MIRRKSKTPDQLSGFLCFDEIYSNEIDYETANHIGDKVLFGEKDRERDDGGVDGKENFVDLLFSKFVADDPGHRDMH